MNVEIPEEFSDFMQDMILRGNYRDENELVFAALRLLKSQEQLRKYVDSGIEQLEAGKGLEGDEVFARLEKRAKHLADQKAE